MKINSISNLNFKANKKQEKLNRREYSKKDLLFASGLGVSATYANAISNTNKSLPQAAKKSFKEYFTKENLKTFTKHTANIAIATLIIASIADFIFKDREKAIDAILYASDRE